MEGQIQYRSPVFIRLHDPEIEDELVIVNSDEISVISRNCVGARIQGNTLIRVRGKDLMLAVKETPAEIWAILVGAE